MSTRCYFDTSALIKLYHDETGTDDLSDMIASENPDIVISDLTTIEMVSALAKKVRMNDIDKHIFQKVVLAFESDIQFFDVVKIDEKIKIRAVELLKSIGLNRGLKTLDALQLACALYASENVAIDRFIVSDSTLGDIAENQGMNVHTV